MIDFIVWLEPVDDTQLDAIVERYSAQDQRAVVQLAEQDHPGYVVYNISEIEKEAA